MVSKMSCIFGLFWLLAILHMFAAGFPIRAGKEVEMLPREDTFPSTQDLTKNTNTELIPEKEKIPFKPIHATKRYKALKLKKRVVPGKGPDRIVYREDDDSLHIKAKIKARTVAPTAPALPAYVKLTVIALFFLAIAIGAVMYMCIGMFIVQERKLRQALKEVMEEEDF